MKLNSKTFIYHINSFILLTPTGADSGFSASPYVQNEKAVAMAIVPLQQPEVYSQINELLKGKSSLVLHCQDLVRQFNDVLWLTKTFEFTDSQGNIAEGISNTSEQYC